MRRFTSLRTSSGVPFGSRYCVQMPPCRQVYHVATETFQQFAMRVCAKIMMQPLLHPAVGQEVDGHPIRLGQMDSS